MLQEDAVKMVLDFLPNRAFLLINGKKDLTPYNKGNLRRLSHTISFRYCSRESRGSSYTIYHFSKVSCYRNWLFLFRRCLCFIVDEYGNIVGHGKHRPYRGSCKDLGNKL
jgi:hypothetical protein